MRKQYAGAILAAGLWACGPGEMTQGQEEKPGATSAPLTATATYDSTLKVPRCTGVASGCDSGGLVNGRGPVGPELNAPNTLGGTCMDGTAGTYHSDESVDRVKVYTTDGTDLAPGKQVTLEVEVWAWSNYTQDSLDLYYAADASNPTWNFITTLVPTGAGAQMLRVNYTLPAGGSTQAVRAAFRYMNSAAACADGSFEDHPDGTVLAWGDNGNGQLGNGTTAASTTPVRVTGLNNVESIAVGDHHSLALKRMEPCGPGATTRTASSAMELQREARRRCG